MDIELLNYFIAQNWMIVLAFGFALIMTIISFKKAAINTLTPEYAVRVINDGATIVDVREITEFELGHIQDSINLPLSQIKKAPEKAAKKLGDKSEVLMYCRSGNQVNAAFKVLKKFIPVANLRCLQGGIDEWKRSNFPVQQKLKNKKTKSRA